MTILESLLAISAYPIPLRTAEAVTLKRSLDMSETMGPEMYQDAAYRLASADIMMWLYFAPTVSQGGQSYNLTDAQRAEFKRRALKIYDELGGEEDKNNGIKYGYKGENL